MSGGTPADPARPWADLEPGLVSSVAARCALADYASCRAACAAWRAALPPPLSRPLAVLPADATGRHHHPVSLAACSLHARRWARLPLPRLQPASTSGATAAGWRCVGASRDGWLALVAGDATAPAAGPVLFHPFTGEEIPLDASLYEPAHEPAPKIVLAPGPTPRDFVAVSLCRPDKVAVDRASDGHRSSFTEETGPLMGGAVLVDVAYGGDGKVYCLARDGEVHVLHLNRRRRRRRACGWSPAAGEAGPLPATEVGPLPDMPLGADAFPPPYDVIARFTDAKNLALCDGVLYQIWRRPIGAGCATVDAPPGAAGAGRRWIHVFEGDVFVLRYDPGNWPSGACWTVAEAKDLGGNAVFVGMNDAAVVRGDGVSANSVYYWNSPRGGGDFEAVVYNMATGGSVRWPAASAGAVGSPVWYFLPAGDGRRVEAEAADVVEAMSAEATAAPEDEEEDHATAHCIKKTMSLLGRLDYSMVYESPCEVGKD